MLISELTIFAEWKKKVACTHGVDLQSDWYRLSQLPEVDNVSHGCYLAFSFRFFFFFFFLGKSLGMRLPIAVDAFDIMVKP